MIIMSLAPLITCLGYYLILYRIAFKYLLKLINDLRRVFNVSLRWCSNDSLFLMI